MSRSISWTHWLSARLPLFLTWLHAHAHWWRPMLEQMTQMGRRARHMPDSEYSAAATTCHAGLTCYLTLLLPAALLAASRRRGDWPDTLTPAEAGYYAKISYLLLFFLCGGSFELTIWGCKGSVLGQEIRRVECYFLLLRKSLKKWSLPKAHILTSQPSRSCYSLLEQAGSPSEVISKLLPLFFSLPF